MSRSTHPIAKRAGQAEIVRPTVWLLGRFGDSLTLFTQLTGTVVVVLVGTILAEFLYQAFDLTRLSIFFLGSVIVSALAFGTRAAVFAALLAFVAYNFSLVEPRFSFRFAGADDTLTLAAFLVVALLTGSLAGRVRESERNNRQRADLLETLFEASQAYSSTDGEAELRRTLADRLEVATGGAALVLPPSEMLDPTQVPEAMQATVRTLIARSHHDPSLQTEGAWRARRLSEDEALGMAIWRIGETRLNDIAVQDRLCEVLIDLAAASLARTRLADVQAEAEAERRAGPLREAILASLSHDLRTPLATVLASASSLRDYDGRFDSQTRIGLADGIVQEAERLNTYVDALINLSRIESGDVSPRLVPVSVHEVIDKARQRLGNFGDTRVALIAKGATVDVRADPLLLEQVLFNILENAERHGGEGVSVTIATRQVREQVEISIEDDGPGVSPAEGAMLFEKFYRGARQQTDDRGTGIGLSIARGFVEAMGGTLRLNESTRPSMGLRLELRLPAAESVSS